MAKKKAVRRENGRGTVEKVNSKKNPFRAKVPVETKVDKNGKTQAIYKTLGTFPTREDNDPKGQQSTKMTYDIYRGRFTNVMKEMGFRGLTPHCTRHTNYMLRCHMLAVARREVRLPWNEEKLTVFSAWRT